MTLPYKRETLYFPLLGNCIAIISLYLTYGTENPYYHKGNTIGDKQMFMLVMKYIHFN